MTEISEHDTANTYILRILLDGFVAFSCEPVTQIKHQYHKLKNKKIAKF